MGAVAKKGSTKKGSTKKGGAVAKKGSTTKGSTKNGSTQKGSTQKGSTQKGRTEAKKDSSNTDIIILSSNIPSDDSIQPGLVLNSENIPQCDLTGCKDITVKSLNANQTVGITKLTVTLNEASIRLRPFTVVVFRQLVDSQVFLMDEEPKGPPQSRTTKVLAPQATEDSPESPVEETVEDQSLDNEATVLTTADDEASLSQIEADGDKEEEEKKRQVDKGQQEAKAGPGMVFDGSKVKMTGLVEICRTSLIQVIKIVACIPTDHLGLLKKCKNFKRVVGCYRKNVDCKSRGPSAKLNELVTTEARVPCDFGHEALLAIA